MSFSGYPSGARARPLLKPWLTLHSPLQRSRASYHACSASLERGINGGVFLGPHAPEVRPSRLPALFCACCDPACLPPALTSSTTARAWVSGTAWCRVASPGRCCRGGSWPVLGVHQCCACSGATSLSACRSRSSGRPSRHTIWGAGRGGHSTSIPRLASMWSRTFRK